jgi:hypothetical protein
MPRIGRGDPAKLLAAQGFITLVFDVLADQAAQNLLTLDPGSDVGDVAGPNTRTVDR